MFLPFLCFLFLFGEVQSEDPFYRIHFTIKEFRHVTRRYPSHYCCWEEADKEECTSCSIKFKISSNFGTFDLDEDTRKIDTFEINKDYYFTNAVQQPCHNITLGTYEWYTNKLIDAWRVTCLNIPPGENYTFNNELGIFKNMRASFDIWFECEGYAGPNCIRECSPNSRSYCDRDGYLRCKDGFANPPQCNLDSPCVRSPCMNGGECKALSTNDYSCECTQLWTGQNCNTQRCDPSKCAGNCENGECVCTADKVDPSCTSFSCEGNFLCKNNGTCGQINGETFCVCPATTSGAYCQFYCPNGCMNGKCAGDDRGNSVCRCYPDFGGDMCEIPIDNSKPQPPPIGQSMSTQHIIAISFSVIFALLSAGLILKIVFDRYNIQILEKLVNNPVGSTRTDEEVVAIGNP